MKPNDQDDFLPGEREKIDATRRKMEAGTFKPEEEERSAVEEGGYVDNAKGIRLIDPTDRFVFEHQANGDIFLLDTKQYDESGGLAPDGDGEPQDDDQRDDHPFAISVQVTGSGGSGEANVWRVKALGGTYATGNGAPLPVTGGDYPAVVLDQTQYRNPGMGQLPVKTVILLFVPVEPCNSGDTGAVKCSDGRFARAIAGGTVFASTFVPAAFPVRIFSPTVGQAGFFVHIGTWTNRYAEQGSGGTTTRENRVSVNQLVMDDVVLDSGADTDDAPHAFKPTAPSGGSITIASGFVNSIPVTGTGGATWSVGTAEAYWVAITTNSSGVATAAAVARGATVPSDTATLAHQILFEVDATGAVTSQHVFSSLRHQRCNGVHLIGGLGFGGA